MWGQFERGGGGRRRASLLGLWGPALDDMGATNHGSTAAVKEKLKSIEQHATTILNVLDEVTKALPPTVE